MMKNFLTDGNRGFIRLTGPTTNDEMHVQLYKTVKIQGICTVTRRSKVALPLTLDQSPENAFSGFQRGRVLFNRGNLCQAFLGTGQRYCKTVFCIVIPLG